MATSERDRAAFVRRNGRVYFEGMSVPVRELERARRAGSSEVELRAAFPELPLGAFDQIDAFLRVNPTLASAWGGTEEVAARPDAGVDDDGAGLEADLETVLESHAELFRRLAQ